MDHLTMSIAFHDNTACIYLYKCCIRNVLSYGHLYYHFGYSLHESEGLIKKSASFKSLHISHTSLAHQTQDREGLQITRTLFMKVLSSIQSWFLSQIGMRWFVVHCMCVALCVAICVLLILCVGWMTVHCSVLFGHPNRVVELAHGPEDRLSC